MRISIFGLGYVGTVTGACLAHAGHNVVTVDMDPVKVACLRDGRAPIVEPELAGMIAATVAAGRLTATLSCEDAIMQSDMSLICVGTPGDAEGALSLDSVVAVCRDIGAVLKHKDRFHTVVLRSTVLPGTGRDVAIPALEAASGKKAGPGFGYCSNPEFLREGSAIRDYFTPPKIVVGAHDERTAQTVLDMYDGIDAPRAVTTVEIAESVKYADNIWHATKIAFANELGNVLKAHGVDSHAVMDIFCLDTKLNISKAYLKPGFSFGGSCLPKDLRAFRAGAKAKGIPTPFFDSLLAANEEQTKRGYEMIMQAGRKKVALMGLAFKPGTDDLRESPLVKLAGMLVNSGIELSIYDPGLNAAVNQSHIRAALPHIAHCLVATAEGLDAEVFVIGHNTPEFTRIARSNDNAIIIDLVKIKHEGGAFYKGICW